MMFLGKQQMAQKGHKCCASEPTRVCILQEPLNTPFLTLLVLVPLQFDRVNDLAQTLVLILWKWFP